MKLRLALLASFVIVVMVIILLSNGSDFATQLSVGITLLLVPLWLWAIQDKIKKIVPKTQEDVKENKSVVQKTRKDSMLSADVSKETPNSTSVHLSSLLEQLQLKKDVKNSIYLPNQDEPEK